MSAKVLAFAVSPRRDGNSRILLNEFVDECVKLGHEVETVDLADRAKWNIEACLGCDYCQSGVCIRKDAMQELYPKLRDANAIVISSPIYFFGLPSHAKAMIDRCQLFYNMKRVKKNPYRTAPGQGFLIACGGARAARLFDGAVLTAKIWFDDVGIEYAGDALFPGIDAAGAIREHPEAFDQVRTLARRIKS